MDYTNCGLYKLSSKKVLKYLLGVNNQQLKQENIIKQITPYIEESNDKKRLIEAPNDNLKKAQRRIKGHLSRITVPKNIFSGIKKRSYIDNARLHRSNRFLYKIDISSFFPSIPRDNVYKFFLNDLRCAPDIAEILTNFTTIDLDMATIRNSKTVEAFLDSKKIITRNHLISGAPTSQILSYLSNHNLFDNLNNLAKKHGYLMTVYVDDITFSGEEPISCYFRGRVKKIIQRYGFKISSQKTVLYKSNQPKLVTGVIITKNSEMRVKNSLRKKTIECMKKLKDNPECANTRERLKGLVIASRQIEPNIFPSIKNLAYEKRK